MPKVYEKSADKLRQFFFRFQGEGCFGNVEESIIEGD